jgi:transaldolase
MSIWIDSANLQEIEWAMSLGWVTGVTTNPQLLALEDRPVTALLEQIRDNSRGPVFYQILNNTPHTMEKEAQLAASILGDRLVLKMAPTPVGFDFISKQHDYRFCPTAVFSPAQALIAREVHADYVAVYVNRATRLMGDGIKLVAEISEILSDCSTQILAASLKSPAEVVTAINAGAQHVTLPHQVLEQMIHDPHSRAAIAAFEQNGRGLLS